MDEPQEPQPIFTFLRADGTWEGENLGPIDMGWVDEMEEEIIWSKRRFQHER